MDKPTYDRLKAALSSSFPKEHQQRIRYLLYTLEDIGIPLNVTLNEIHMVLTVAEKERQLTATPIPT